VPRHQVNRFDDCGAREQALSLLCSVVTCSHAHTASDLMNEGGLFNMGRNNHGLNLTTLLQPLVRLSSYRAARLVPIDHRGLNLTVLLQPLVRLSSYRAAHLVPIDHHGLNLTVLLEPLVRLSSYIAARLVPIDHHGLLLK
jgi:hypothetical protein